MNSFNYVDDLLRPLAEWQPQKAALIAVDELGSVNEFTFAEVLRCASRAAAALGRAGVGRGDAVLTYLGSTPEWIWTLLGSWQIGAIAVPCSEMLRSSDLKLRLDRAEPHAVVATEKNLPELRPALGSETVIVADQGGLLQIELGEGECSPTSEADPALIIFTSGTTGEPKPAVHTQGYLKHQEIQAKQWMDCRPDDIVWCTAATGWSKSSRNVFVAPWHTGATAVIHDGKFDPAERLELIERLGVTVLCQAPTEYRMIAKRVNLQPNHRANLRHLVSAGEPLNSEVIEAFEESLGLSIYDGYGQTETGAITAMPLDAPARPGAMGRPFPGYRTEIRDGELYLHTPSIPTMFSGYLGEDGTVPEWWATGDMVSEDQDGYLWFEGRDDDIILSAGYRIGPFEVESALISHPKVVDAAAVAAPDEERGSVVKAFVVLRGAEPGDGLITELQEHVKAVTAPYKYPRQIEFVESLPKTPSGKVKRHKLRN